MLGFLSGFFLFLFLFLFNKEYTYPASRGLTFGPPTHSIVIVDVTSRLTIH